MNEKRWNAVRQFYMESFGISPELVDLMASNEILLMCVSGSSNSSISKILNINEDDIVEILDTILNFRGWSKDLEFNPLKIYENDPQKISFIGSIVELSDKESLDIGSIETIYEICKIYKSIEDKLDVEWV